MFNFFGRSPVPPPTQLTEKTLNNDSTEIYRVGLTTDGRTTLTLMSKDGFAVTVSMTSQACERMIRMIRATYEGEKDDQSEIQS